jgi:exodeoxyribonuclease V alpha subunit
MIHSISKAFILKIIYKDTKSAFKICKIKNIDTAEEWTLKGNLTQLSENTTIYLKAQEINDKTYGKQLELIEFYSHLPHSTKTLLASLEKGYIKGIGPEFSKKLYEVFGEKLIDIFINEEFNKLEKISGLGKQKIEVIKQSWISKKALHHFFLFAGEKDISFECAQKIYDIYNEKSQEILTNNPYDLVHVVPQIGFLKADEIAQKCGLDKYSSYRLQSALLHTLHKHGEMGHLYITKDSLFEYTKKLLENIEDNPLEKELNILINKQHIIKYNHSEHIIWYGLFADYEIEKKIAEEIKKKIHNPSIYNFSPEKYNLICKEFNLSEEQQKILQFPFLNDIGIITGGPGTGKTTTLRALLKILDMHGLTYTLCAPTGRAAQRMMETTGYKSSTIHSLLHISLDEKISAASTEYIKTNLLIVDEMSMVDMYLFYRLIKSASGKTKFFLIGDPFQIPSVGKGSVLKDLIESKTLPHIHLTKIFRQKEDNILIDVAYYIKDGKFIPNKISENPIYKNQFMFIDEANHDNAKKKILDLYNQHKSTDVKIISILNKGKMGVHNLNKYIQEHTNNTNEEVEYFSSVFKKNDIVINTKNNYELGVFNGDIGTIISIEDGNIRVQFTHKNVLYEPQNFSHLQLAYAITAHKSQGAEFDTVIIPLFMEQYMFLYRNLLYTAITRAKKKCIIIGEKKALFCAIKKEDQLNRNTLLNHFLLLS